MIVVIDNTNRKKIFLPKLLQALENMKVPHVKVHNITDLQNIPKETIQGFILSGSSQNLQDLTMEEYIMNVLAIEHGCPVLGICFGSQFLHVYHGGQLVDMQRVTCRDIPIHVIPTRDFITAKFCNRYTFKEPANGFEKIAEYAIDGITYMCMFKHKNKPLWGTLFHPEGHRETYIILEAFVHECRTRNLKVDI